MQPLDATIPREYLDLALYSSAQTTVLCFDTRTNDNMLFAWS